MAPKSAAVKAAPSKKDSKKESKTEAAAKPEKKSAKAAAAHEIEVQASDAPVVDLEEIEEAADEAAAASSNSGGNAAALAAAGGSTEMSASFKNFRHHPDMENFYRFIYDNDLRHEAAAIIDEVMIEKAQRKVVKSAKANAH